MADDEIRLNDLLQLNDSFGKFGARAWPVGVFTMSVDMARQGVTRGGKTKLAITLLCKAGERAGEFYMWDLVFDPNNPEYFLNRLHTLGATPDFLESNPSLAEICLQIIGSTEYQVTFRESVNNGRPTTEISYLERI